MEHRVLLGPFRVNCGNGGSTAYGAGISHAECTSTVDGQRGGTDESAGASGAIGMANARLVLTHGTSGDWSVVFRSCAALVHPALKDELQRVESLLTAETNAGLIEGEQVQASSDDLCHLLLHSTSGPALDRVVNAGSAEGLRAWQLLVERYDPHIRSRTAGQPLSLLQFDFSGDMLAKLEAYECDLALYEQASGEKISDGLHVGIVLNRVTDTELATHLLLNSERFQTWALFRRELVDISRTRAAASGAYQMRRGAKDSNTAPMEIDSLGTRGATRAEDSVTS